MTVPGKRSTFEELLNQVGELIDQIKVLVTAVDDLRCEVEWQARNQAQAAWTVSSSLTDDLSKAALTAEIQPPTPPDEAPFASAAQALRAYEDSLSLAPRGIWLDEWAEHDDFEMPTGRIISVDIQLWNDVLEIRPAHVIGEGCCCEEGEGAPYLLAWENGEEFLLRELSDEEARRLQELCLASQAAEARKCENAIPEKTQLGLF